MPTPKTFSQCLNALMQKHRLTPAALGAQIGAKTELNRALVDESPYAKLQTLCRKMAAHGVFTPDEQAGLETSLEVTRLGAERYVTLTSLDKLFGFCPVTSAKDVRILDGGMLSGHVKAWLSSDRVEILCLNACHLALMTALSPLFEDKNRAIRMDHFVQLDETGSDPASFVLSASPILFDTRYMAYGIERGSTSPQDVSGSFLAVSAEIGGRLRQWFFAINADETAYELSGASKANLFGFFRRILEDVSPRPFPLKEFQAGMIDYVSFIMQCLRRELNRSTYTLSRDICFAQIPRDIALRAFEEQGAVPPEMMGRLIAQVTPVHEKRFENFYQKRKPAYWIMTLEGCRRLLKTGYSGDHFFGFRAFTPEERTEILTQMLRAAERNPFFRPLFLKQKTAPRFFCVCYDNLGVGLARSDADYDLQSGYDQVLLTIPGFMRLFKEYYLKTMVRDHCYSQEESMALLRGLIEGAAGEAPGRL